MYIGTAYQLTRLIDDVTLTNGGKPEMWPKLTHPLAEQAYAQINDQKALVERPTYGGTLMVASALYIASPNQTEMDLRILLEHGRIEVIGEYPEMTGLQIMHQLEAVAYLKKYFKETKPDEQREIVFPFKTLLVLKYKSGVLKLPQAEIDQRLIGLDRRPADNTLPAGATDLDLSGLSDFLENLEER